MSLVGTRPILPDELEQYELHHRARIAIKPGITGMWQVSGRSDITDFEEIVRLDTEYISEEILQRRNQRRKSFKDKSTGVYKDMITVGWKNWLFSASPKGAASSAIVYTMVNRLFMSAV